MKPWITRLLFGLPLLAAASLAPSTADAFCGFYVSGTDSTLLNNATQVVLMRDGNRTVQTMQNNYQGPPEAFAMIIPVPVVLMEDNVKIANDEVIKRVDVLTSPRLVEYWEQDPCGYHGESNNADFNNNNPSSANNANNTNNSNNNVVVEAEFKVGEYDIVILSATEGAGLESWLTGNGYNIPSGAAPLLDPYIEGGSYFFVAKVDVEKVTFRDGKAVLSPLRFWYESPEFSLPIRLGMVNSEEVQDLVVYTLGRNQRFEAANYPNVTIPTNIEVVDSVRERFGSFYNALFEETLRQNAGAVVTEYSWVASNCDPCPGPVLDAADIATLGGDVVGGADDFSWTVTRLHARYAPGSIAEDLVFRTAPAIVGGREFVIDYETGELERGAQPSEFGGNNFQSRYAIRHRWEGAIDCEEPVRGIWGGPPGNPYGTPTAEGAGSPNSTGGEIDRGEGVVLQALVAERVEELGIEPDPTATPEPGPSTTPAKPGDGDSSNRSEGCSTAAGDTSLPAGLVLLALGLGALLTLRRR